VGGSDEFTTITVTLAIVTGVMLILMGLARLGVLADFLSKPVLDGFIVGVAITIVIGQLDKLLGYEVEASLEFVPDILVILTNFGQTHWPTLVVGLVSLALLFLMEEFVPKIPAAITVLFLAIIVSALVGFEELGIHVVGEIPAGLPDFGIPSVTLEQVLALIPGALAIAVVAFAESVATARTYGTKFGYKVDADQELIALGAANAGSGVSGGFVVDGSLSKTAASVEAGAKSQMVSIVAAVFVLITAAFLTPLFYSLPEATLGAIVIHAVWHLINFRKLANYRKITALDFWTAVVAMFGVLLIGILEGLLLAVFIGLFSLVVSAKRAVTSILSRVPGTNIYRSLENYPDGETFPGLLILRFDGTLFFANAPDFVEELRLGVELTEPTPKVVLIDAETLNDIDYTAVAMTDELLDEFAENDIEIWFTRVRGNVREIMDRAGFVEKIGTEHFYNSVHEGVDAFQSK
jgi:high affinity sulfate transporter 1